MLFEIEVRANHWHETRKIDLTGDPEMAEGCQAGQDGVPLRHDEAQLSSSQIKGGFSEPKIGASGGTSLS